MRDGDGARLALGAGLAGRWRDVLTGAEHRLGETADVAPLVSAYGVGLLERS